MVLAVKFVGVLTNLPGCGNRAAVVLAADEL